jgi:hypothetical protein
MINNGNSKRQIEFAPLQTHVKGFELAMIAICVIMAIVVLLLVLLGVGNDFRPSA